MPGEITLRSKGHLKGTIVELEVVVSVTKTTFSGFTHGEKA
jgi:hypothetical protein